QSADRLAPARPADPLAQVRRGAPGADARRTGAHPGQRRAVQRRVRGGQQEPRLSIWMALPSKRSVTPSVTEGFLSLLPLALPLQAASQTHCFLRQRLPISRLIRARRQ